MVARDHNPYEKTININWLFLRIFRWYLVKTKLETNVKYLQLKFLCWCRTFRHTVGISTNWFFSRERYGDQIETTEQWGYSITRQIFFTFCLLHLYLFKKMEVRISKLFLFCTYCMIYITINKIAGDNRQLSFPRSYHHNIMWGG